MTNGTHRLVMFALASAAASTLSACAKSRIADNPADASLMPNGGWVRGFASDTPSLPTDDVDAGVSTISGGSDSVCVWTEFPGVCVIRSIETAPRTSSTCPNDGVRVICDFVPNDPSAPSHYARSREDQNLNFGPSSLFPPRQCLTEAGLSVGSRISAVRKEGNRRCPRAFFAFDEDLLSRCRHECTTR